MKDLGESQALITEGLQQRTQAMILKALDYLNRQEQFLLHAG